MFLEVFCSESINSEQWGDSDSILITHLTLLYYLILFMWDWTLSKQDTLKGQEWGSTDCGFCCFNDDDLKQGNIDNLLIGLYPWKSRLLVNSPDSSESAVSQNRLMQHMGEGVQPLAVIGVVTYADNNSL